MVEDTQPRSVPSTRKPDSSAAAAPGGGEFLTKCSALPHQKQLFLPFVCWHLVLLGTLLHSVIATTVVKTPLIAEAAAATRLWVS